MDPFCGFASIIGVDLGKRNGSQEHAAFRDRALRRYGNTMMTAEGSLAASLSEPCCDHTHDDAEERLESVWWDRMCLNAVRVLALDLDPKEDFT